MSDHDEERIRDAFDLIDSDGSGSIDVQELHIAMTALGFHPTPKQLREMMDAVDTDGSGMVEFGEFREMMLAKLSEKDAENDLKLAFELFDQEGKGFISTDDLERVANQIGDETSREVIYICWVSCQKTHTQRVLTFFFLYISSPLSLFFSNLHR